MTKSDPIQWLLESDEPWTRYRTLVDLLDRTEDDPEVQAARAEMLAHPQVQALIAEAATWPGYALKRHNDAKATLSTSSAPWPISACVQMMPHLGVGSACPPALRL